MPLVEKEPLEQGKKVSGTIALPEALWAALDREVAIEGYRSRSALATEILIFGIHELQKRRDTKAKK